MVEDSRQAVSRILTYFHYKHLPEELQEVSRPMGELAALMAKMLPWSPEAAEGFRKLMEAKDCFVRAALDPKLLK